MLACGVAVVADGDDAVARLRDAAAGEAVGGGKVDIVRPNAYHLAPVVAVD